MKKILDWFLKQTLGTKIALIVLVFVVLIGGIFTLASTLNQNNEEPTAPTITNTPIPTAAATSEPVEPEDGIDGGSNVPVKDSDHEHEDGEEEDEGHFDELETIQIPAGAPYTAEDFALMQLDFIQKATLEACTINAGETIEARQTRLSQYFSPDSKTYRTAALPIVENQRCSFLSTKVTSIDRSNFNVTIQTMVTAYTTFTMNEEEQKTAQQDTQTYEYSVNYVNGKWVVVS